MRRASLGAAFNAESVPSAKCIPVEVEELEGHAERFELRKLEHDEDDDEIDEDALSELTLVDSTTAGRA